MSLVTQTVPQKIVLPPVPRPLNRRVSRRAWFEGKVRFWWASALVVTLVMLFVAFTLGSRELKHRRLVEKGVQVDAIAVKVQGVTASMNKNFSVMRDQTIPVEFSALLPGGKLETLTGYLEPAEGFIRVNDKMKLRVDPTDLTWTDQLELKPWQYVLAMPLYLLLPIVVILLGIAELRRRMVLAVWRDGMRGKGVVVDVRHTAAAPGSRIVHFTVAEGNDRRVFTALWPTSEGVPQRGQELTLIYPADRPQNAIIADLYTRPGDRQPAA
jgi:hypothetical protein